MIRALCVKRGVRDCGRVERLLMRAFPGRGYGFVECGRMCRGRGKRGLSGTRERMFGEGFRFVLGEYLSYGESSLMVFDTREFRKWDVKVWEEFEGSVPKDWEVIVLGDGGERSSVSGNVDRVSGYCGFTMIMRQKAARKMYEWYDVGLSVGENMRKAGVYGVYAPKKRVISGSRRDNRRGFRGIEF